MSSSNREIVEEQSQRVYSLFERKSKSFRSAMIGVLGLVTIVFLLIFYPYATFRGTNYVLEAELETLNRDIAGLKRRSEEHQELIMTFASHEQDALDAFADFNLNELQAAAGDHKDQLAAVREALGDIPELQPWLRGEAADKELPPALRRRHPELASISDDPCFWLQGQAWLQCALALHIERLHNEISRRFASGHISHLRNELFGPVSDSLTTLHSDFRAWLLGTAPSWEVDGVEAEGKLVDHYDLFSRAYLELINKHYRRIAELQFKTDNDLYSLETERGEIEAELASVNSRLEEMKNLRDVRTPFGPLPIGLNDLVLIFPVLLAAAFLLTGSLYSETLRLRCAFHKLCRSRDPNNEILDGDQVSLVAPVWIDPLQSKVHQAFGLAILALPAVAFIVSIAILWENELLSGAFMDEVRLGSIFYIALYVVSGLSILEGGRRVFLTLKAYYTDLSNQ